MTNFCTVSPLSGLGAPRQVLRSVHRNSFRQGQGRMVLLLIPGSFLTSGHRRQRLHCSNERTVSSIMDSWDSEAHSGCLSESVGSSLLLVSDMQRHLEWVTQLSRAEMLRWAKWLSWEIIIQLGTLVWNTWLYMMHIKAIWIHNF